MDTDSEGPVLGLAVLALGLHRLLQESGFINGLLAMKKWFVILVAVTLALGATSQASTPSGMSSVVPSLDVLAGDWMPVKTLCNLPSVNNFWGALKTTTNL